MMNTAKTVADVIPPMVAPAAVMSHSKSFDMAAGVELLQSLLRRLLEPREAPQRGRRRVKKPEQPTPAEHTDGARTIARRMPR